MNRLLVICLVSAAMMGCRSSSCCRKPPTTCNSCAAVPPPPVILGAPPTTSSRQPEILLPAPPGSPAPLTAPTPAPSFSSPPPPVTSGYAPPPDFPPSRIANVPTTPEIQLGKPEFTETAQKTSVTLKPVAGVMTASHSAIEPVEVMAGKVATGRRPTLDDLDRLQQMGYRQVLDLSDSAKSANAKSVFAARSIEVTNIDGNGSKIVAQAMKDTTSPVYVFADDPQTLRSFWQKFYRENEHLSDDAAKICAARLVP